MEWFDLPDALIRYITTFFNDDDLFRLRGTCLLFYAAYYGPRYRGTRASDGKTADVGVLVPGGFANVATHDAFCVEQDCVIQNVFDQSPMGNHLGPRHKLVNASQHRITVGDEVEVYGM